MSFKSALQSIGKGIEDLSQLNVRTYTGKIGGQVQGADAQDIMDKALNNGDLNVVGITTMKLDGDVDQFISNDDAIDQKLHDAHFTAVQAGQRSRKAIFDMFTSKASKVIEDIDLGANP